MRRVSGVRLGKAMLLQLTAALLGLPILGILATSTGTASSAAATVRTYENDTVVLPCHVEDLGLRTRVRWWRGKVLLADSEQPTVAPAGQQQQQRIKMWGNRSLELAGVKPEDSGEYICQASRPEPWGHVTQVHEIQVMYPASVKPIPESGQLEVTLGDEAILGCESRGLPKPTLTWYLEGQELPVIAAGEKLRLRADNRSLAGLYTCEASNGIGEPARANIDLKIKHKPEVKAITRWLHSAPGIRVQLECLVQAWPEAQLDWFFEGNQLGQYRPAHYLRRNRQDQATGGQFHSLTIRYTEVQDLGQYSCKASNELGSAEASIELSGRPKPPLLKKEARASSSSSYNFIFEADSYSPVVEYQFWFRQMDCREDWHRLHIPSGNEAAGPLHARSYNLTGLPPSRQYEALVLARNRFGWSSPSKIVRFATVPASTTAEEQAYKTDSAGHEKIPSAVQVTSDSHRSALDANSSVPGCLYSSPALTPLLLMAFVVLRS